MSGCSIPKRTVKQVLSFEKIKNEWLEKRRNIIQNPPTLRLLLQSAKKAPVAPVKGEAEWHMVSIKSTPIRFYTADLGVFCSRPKQRCLVSLGACRCNEPTGKTCLRRKNMIPIPLVMVWSQTLLLPVHAGLKVERQNPSPSLVAWSWVSPQSVFSFRGTAGKSSLNTQDGNVWVVPPSLIKWPWPKTMHLISTHAQHISFQLLEDTWCLDAMQGIPQWHIMVASNTPSTAVAAKNRRAQSVFETSVLSEARLWK